MKIKNAIHPLQSPEWAEFRRKIGLKVIQKNNFSRGAGSRFAGQLTIHRISHLPWNVGYLPKGPLPTQKMMTELKRIGKEENCIFIQLEPNVPLGTSEVAEWTPRRWRNLGVRPSTHPLFTKYTFQIDLTKSEEELLKNMHPKTRYNIRVAQKHGVKVVEDNSDKAFKIYLKLLKETTGRQKFYAHNEDYHQKMWESLRPAGIAHLLLAQLPTANDQRPMTLTAWILFVYDNVLYYPYGASSDKYKEVMASNLIMWEAILFGKKMGLKTFDLWGSLGPNPDKNDPWYGFHRFKEGYGGKLVEFVGSYDLIIKPFWYRLYILLDKLRWLFLRLVKK